MCPRSAQTIASDTGIMTRMCTPATSTSRALCEAQVLALQFGTVVALDRVKESPGAGCKAGSRGGLGPMVPRKSETFESVTLGHIRSHGCRDLMWSISSRRGVSDFEDFPRRLHFRTHHQARGGTRLLQPERSFAGSESRGSRARAAAGLHLLLGGGAGEGRGVGRGRGLGLARISRTGQSRALRSSGLWRICRKASKGG
jgi:hypothetical protein